MYDELNIDLLTPTPFLNVKWSIFFSSEYDFFDVMCICFCFFYFLLTFVNKIDIDYGYF